MPYVYILKSINDNRFYIGSTVNIAIRLNHHKNGHTPSTKRFGEIELVFSQEYAALQEARSVERKLKRLKRRDYIEKIIKDGFIKIKP